jgi:hypothetical protein
MCASESFFLCCMNQTSCCVVSGFLLSGLNLSSKPNMQNCSYEVLNIVVISIFSVLLTCYIVQIRTICMLWYSCAQQGQLDRKVWTAVQLVYHLQFTIVYIRKLLSQQKKLKLYCIHLQKPPVSINILWTKVLCDTRISKNVVELCGVALSSATCNNWCFNLRFFWPFPNDA